MTDPQPTPTPDKPRTEFWPGQNSGEPPPASHMAPGQTPYTREEWARVRALISGAATENERSM